MVSFSVRASLCALFAALALTGCGDDGGETTAGTGAIGGTAGSTGGTGGVAGMTGGTGGVAGMTGGTGGMAGTTGGTGGMTGGVGGGGSGGMTGGMGGGGAGGTGGAAGDGLPGCEVAMTGEGPALHAAAIDALEGGCSFSSCHDADGERAGLIILEGDDLSMTIVDKAACQVPSLMLVKSGGGDAALAGSWVWQKLAAPDDASFNIIPQDIWGQPVVCQQTSGFGTRMPMTGVDLSDMRIAAIRNWICAGAPGPM